MANATLYISYRRSDSRIAGRLYDRLTQHFGRRSVFMDIEALQTGVDFRQFIEEAIRSAGVVIVIIGYRWLADRRIHDPDDFIHVEISTALRRGTPVIPVLVDGAAMPRVSDLPEDLQELTFRNAMALDAGIDFSAHGESDWTRLIAEI
jgi:hypothetical protein